jgi:hypothetical protein
MSFIVTKKSRKYGNERLLYYLVESYREDGKIKRRNLLALGTCKAVADLLGLTEQKEVGINGRISILEKKLDNFIKNGVLPSSYVQNDSPKLIKERLIGRVQKLKDELSKCITEKEKIRNFL